MIWLAAVGVASLFDVPSAARAADERNPPSKVAASASCVAGKCHSSVIAGKRVHWPDLQGGCRSCHEQDGDGHDFSLAEAPALCLGCHKGMAEARRTAKIIHWPAQEDCLGCHDPHGSAAPALLTEEGETDLCFQCHDGDEIVGGKYSHGPAQQGACTMCHDPHASTNTRLLVAEGIDLCGQCHEQLVESIREAKYRHDGPECTDCHNPHSGPHPKMLAAEKRAVCGECHGDVVEVAETAAVDHGAVLTGDECVSCHSPHAANSPPNLVAPELELCLGCHSRPVPSGDSLLLDMGGWLAEHKEWHAPLRENSCTGCHQPHGSQHFRLLKMPFPPRFYSGFDMQNYRLCFTCHEASVVTEARTRTLTRFRDGDRNLHFLHVNKPKRGRTCRACHEVHASNHPRHVRESVPYGSWMMPINFRKLENGGSCHPGCHPLAAYDRDAR